MNTQYNLIVNEYQPLRAIYVSGNVAPVVQSTTWSNLMKEYILTSHRQLVADRDKFQKIAEYTGVSMNAQLRIWIRENFDKLPKDAK